MRKIILSFFFIAMIVSCSKTITITEGKGKHKKITVIKKRRL